MISERVIRFMTIRMEALKEMKAPGDALLFPNWQPEVISAYMNVTRDKYSWATTVQYSCYSLRHSAAMKAMEDALEAGREKLKHRGGTKNVLRYASNTKEHAAEDRKRERERATT